MCVTHSPAIFHAAKELTRRRSVASYYSIPNSMRKGRVFSRAGLPVGRNTSRRLYELTRDPVSRSKSNCQSSQSENKFANSSFSSRKMFSSQFQGEFTRDAIVGMHDHFSHDKTGKSTANDTTIYILRRFLFLKLCKVKRARLQHNVSKFLDNVQDKFSFRELKGARTVSYNYTFISVSLLAFSLLFSSQFKRSNYVFKHDFESGCV